MIPSTRRTVPVGLGLTAAAWEDRPTVGKMRKQGDEWRRQRSSIARLPAHVTRRAMHAKAIPGWASSVRSGRGIKEEGEFVSRTSSEEIGMSGNLKPEAIKRYRLTPRQSQVLGLLCHGMYDKPMEAA